MTVFSSEIFGLIGALAHMVLRSPAGLDVDFEQRKDFGEAPRGTQTVTAFLELSETSCYNIVMNPEILSLVLHLSDQELLEQVKDLAEREREATVRLIVHMAELDWRRLYLQEGYSSMFAYCTLALQLSEYAAYARIEAARLSRKFPIILEMLEDGLINLTTVGLLAPHLTQENHRRILEEARHKNKRQVEEIRARLHPQPPVPSSIRRLPTVNHSAASLARHEAAASHQPDDDGKSTESPVLSPLTFVSHEPRPAVVAPLAPERYKIQFTASGEMYKKLRSAQDLLRHEIPNGDPAAIFDRALTALLQGLAKKKLAATDRPREGKQTVPDSRHISADVKRAVWLRDGGRCAFVTRGGCRCAEQGFLEFHHVVPYAIGGAATTNNIQLRCRAHNAYEADLSFGQRRASLVREPNASYEFR